MNTDMPKTWGPYEQTNAQGKTADQIITTTVAEGHGFSTRLFYPTFGTATPRTVTTLHGPPRV
jgi:hypothetical protein